jgi:hypothetical protein
MADGLDASISAAVDSAAAAATPASSADTAPATPSTAAPVAKTATPSAPAGKADAPTSSGKATGRPTRQAAPDSAPQDTSEQIREKQQRELDNRSKKVREDVFAELSTELGFDLSRPEYRANLRAFQQNPAAYVRQFAPQWGVKLAEDAAAAQPVPDGPPEPDLVAEDGVTRAYSAEGLAAWGAWQQRQLMTQLDTRFGQIEGITGPLKQALAWQEALRQAAPEVEEAKTWDHFEDLRQEIHDIMKADGRATLGSAYARALKNNSARFRDESRNAVLTELKSSPRAVDTAPVGSATRANSKPRGNTLDRAIESALEQHASR